MPGSRPSSHGFRQVAENAPPAWRMATAGAASAIVAESLSSDCLLASLRVRHRLFPIRSMFLSLGHLLVPAGMMFARPSAGDGSAYHGTVGPFDPQRSLAMYDDADNDDDGAAA